MARALGSLWLSNAYENARNACIQACSWVSMAPALGSLWLLLLGLYGFKMLLKLKKRTHSSLLLGLYAPALESLDAFWDCKKRKHSSVLLGLYGSCSWVSMAPALGSIWPRAGLLFLGLYGSCSWVSMALVLGSLWLLLLGLYGSCSWVSMALVLGSLWLLLLGLLGCIRSRSHQVTSSRNRSHQVARQQVTGLHIRSLPIGIGVHSDRPWW